MYGPPPPAWPPPTEEARAIARGAVIAAGGLAVFLANTVWQTLSTLAMPLEELLADPPPPEPAIHAAGDVVALGAVALSMLGWWRIAHRPAHARGTAARRGVRVLCVAAGAAAMWMAWTRVFPELRAGTPLAGLEYPLLAAQAVAAMLYCRGLFARAGDLEDGWVGEALAIASIIAIGGCFAFLVVPSWGVLAYALMLGPLFASMGMLATLIALWAAVPGASDGPASPS